MHVDVDEKYQIVTANVIECGESKQALFPRNGRSKRYEVEIDVPHVTDAEKVGGTFREV
jgi:hypothetical protein